MSKIHNQKNMKKFLLVFLLLAACAEDPEIKTTQQPADGWSDVPARNDQGGFSPLVLCNGATWNTTFISSSSSGCLHDIHWHTWYASSPFQIEGGQATFVFTNNTPGSVDIWLGTAVIKKYTVAGNGGTKTLYFTIQRCQVNPEINYHLFIDRTTGGPINWTWRNTAWTLPAANLIDGSNYQIGGAAVGTCP